MIYDNILLFSMLVCVYYDLLLLQHKLPLTANLWHEVGELFSISMSIFLLLQGDMCMGFSHVTNDNWEIC